MNNLLSEGLSSLGLPLSIAAPLEIYIEQIELFNPKYGLVNYTSRDELIVKHILDSLAPFALLREKCTCLKSPRIADCGSGAGFPGIPLAAAFTCGQKMDKTTTGEKSIDTTAVSVTLIERGGKRASFLRNMAAILAELPLTVCENDIGAVAAAQFDVVCCRAFSPLTFDFWTKLRRLLARFGCIALWKGRREKIDAEWASMPPQMREMATVFPVTVPFLAEERHLVLFG